MKKIDEMTKEKRSLVRNFLKGSFERGKGTEKAPFFHIVE